MLVAMLGFLVYLCVVGGEGLSFIAVFFLADSGYRFLRRIDGLQLLASVCCVGFV